MKKHVCQLLAILLSFAMCMSIATPAFALGESNNKNVTFSLSLSESNLTESNENQTVTLSIDASEEVNIVDMEYDFTCDSNFIVSETTTPNGTASWDADTCHMAWMANANVATSNLGTIKVTIPGGTSAGEYEFKVSEITLSNDDEDDYWEETAYATATLTIKGSDDPYTATLDTETDIVHDEDTPNVFVDVIVGGNEKTFNSAEFVVEFETDLLTFSGISWSQTATVTGTQKDEAPEVIRYRDAEGNMLGRIKVRDYGGALNTGEKAYTLAFQPVKGGNATVTLTSAGFSTQTQAETNDLNYVKNTSDATVTIKHKVTISDGTSETIEYVAPGDNYVFVIPDYNAGYTYDITATIDGEEVAADRITGDGNGSYTVAGVDGELVITYTKTAISYTVTFDDQTAENVVSNVTGATFADDVYTVPYNTAVGFTVAAGKAPVGTEDGFRYDVKAYLTADANKTPISVTAEPDDVYAERVYTIAAGTFANNITIEVTKVDVSASETTITISDYYTELSKDDVVLNSDTVTVTKGEGITFVLNKELGYDYTVQTKVGEAAAEDVTVATDGSFTITVGQDAMNLIITKTLNTGSLKVTQYIQLNDTIMWLVTINGNGTAQIADKTYTYDGKDMFWSDKYEAYCYLDIKGTLNVETAKTYIGETLADKAAVSVEYDGNVNKTFNGETAVIDVNDAQLVWNMYSAVYSEITTNVTVEKFLKADMDDVVGVNVNDAVAVVGLIPAT